MSVEWGPNVNKTYACPSFDISGPHMNCAAPCSDNTLLMTIFYVSTPLDTANWTAELTLSWIYSLVPTFLVFLPAFYALFLSRKQIPITPLIASGVVGFCSGFNTVVSKIVGLIDTPLKYRPGHDPHYMALYTELYGGYGQSCNHGLGMPSGHSCNAMGAFTWSMSELWCGWGAEQGFTKKQKLSMTLLAAIICLPCLPARIGVFDHTWAQVIVGGFEGIFVGFACFTFTRKYLGPRLQGFCKWINSVKFCPCGTSVCCSRSLVDTYWAATRPSLRESLDLSKLELGNGAGGDGSSDKQPKTPVAAVPAAQEV